MNRSRLLVPAGLLLLALVFALRLCRPTPSSPPPPARPRVTLPLPERPEPRAAPRPVAPGAGQESPERLRPYLEALGRARLLRDRRRLDELRGKVPVIREGDVEWIAAALHGDEFTTAGAAELVRIFGLRRAIPDLGEVLSHPAGPFVKDVAIETLAALGGDGAATVLLAALRSEGEASVRSRCAAALGGFEGPEVYHALAAALRDPSPQVRSAASSALGRLRSAEAARIMVERLSQEADPGVQVELALAAHAAGGPEWLPSVVQALEASPPAMRELLRRQDRKGDARYRRSYDRAFFEAGRLPPVPFDPSGRRIGITVELGAEMSLREVARSIFECAPLDRYRAWFHFRRAEDFPSPKAYDSDGNLISAPVPYDELDGTVYLRFRDPASFAAGVLGYTKGCEAYVTSASLLHELGHALAHLGDEYPKGSSWEAANTVRQVPPPWQPLIDAGHLGVPPRRDEELYIPSENCHLGNRATDARFCPVCQLEIHSRIAERTGAPLPW